MKTIWKYPLGVQDVQTLSMPNEAQILSAAFQGEQLCLWAIVIPTRATTPRSIAIYGTGNEIPTYTDDVHIATVQHGPFVWHVFERLR